MLNFIIPNCNIIFKNLDQVSNSMNQECINARYTNTILKILTNNEIKCNSILIDIKGIPSIIPEGKHGKDKLKYYTENNIPIYYKN